MSTARRVIFTVAAIAVVVASPAEEAVQGTADLRVEDLDLSLEPAVTIEQYENRMMEEYSVNGRTYMIKVTPVGGAPYYLIDNNGSGSFGRSRTSLGTDIVVPQWTLLSW